MPIAITPHETWRYQLEDDRLRAPDGGPGKPDPNGTWWHMRALPAWLEAQITDLIHFSIGENVQLVHPNRGTIERLLLTHGIMRVENWKTADGRDVPFKLKTENGREVADPAFLEYISQKHRAELANAASTRQKVTVEESD